MLREANNRGDRSRGLFAPPKRLVEYRDPLRCYTQQTIATLLEHRGYACFNPFCEFNELSLQAHHIYAHAMGGRTIPNNAIMLCSSCHALVHRGVVPLEVLIEWKRGALKDQSDLVTNSDDLWALVRSIPLSTELTGHERLVKLNDYLIHSNYLKSQVARSFIFGEIMLAKAAVLNDSYRDIGADINSATRSMQWRHMKILPFGSAAKFFGNLINSPAIAVRALHYRSIAYETSGNTKRSLETLREAWTLCKRIAPDGKPGQFHELSTPSRILRAMALARAKLNRSSKQAQKEYQSGLQLAEKFGENLVWDEAELRQVQLELLLGNIKEAEDKLDRIWNKFQQLDANSRLLAQRLRIEMLIHRKAPDVKVLALIEVALEEASSQRLYRQEHNIFRLSQRIRPN